MTSKYLAGIHVKVSNFRSGNSYNFKEFARKNIYYRLEFYIEDKITLADAYYITKVVFKDPFLVLNSKYYRVNSL